MEKKFSAIAYGNVTNVYEESFWDRYEIAGGHHTAFFSNGYVMIDCGYTYGGGWHVGAYLIDKDGQNSYKLERSYLCNASNYGTLVFSKVLVNGQKSSGYYLIDVSKCEKDEYDKVIPTMDAVVSDVALSYGAFQNIFGEIQPYALIQTEDGRWGYMSYDGETIKLYDDATAFSAGYAAVKEGNKIYIIDEDFNRVSDYYVGDDSISSVGNGIFLFQTEDSYEIIWFFRVSDYEDV